MRARHQKGSLTKIKRKNGYLVWLFRWRETGSDGSRRPRNIVVGPVNQLRTEAAARRALETLRLNINLDPSEQARPPRNFRALVDHYRLKELVLQNDERKAYSTKKGYESYLKNWIVPRWGEYMLARMENGIAVHVEEWLGTITRSRGTKAKIRNIMSAVCTHAIRYGWMATNPIRSVRQSAKRERIIGPLTAEELQRLFAELGPRERTLVLLDVPTGMRRGEVLATQWCDIDFGKKTLNIRKSIWQQHLGPVKTDESEKVMPLDDEMIADLLRWRSETPYAGDQDWIFASGRMKGRQPLWPEAIERNYIRPAAERAKITNESEKVMPLDDEMIADLLRWRSETPYAGDQDWIFASGRMKGRQPLWPEAIERNYIRPAAERAKITKHISWHVFRHTFSTLLAENDEDVKTVQSLMRHANSNITMNIYTHAVSSKKRRAQSKVVEMILPVKATSVSAGVA